MREKSDRGTSMLDFFPLTPIRIISFVFICCGTAWEKVWFDELGVLFIFK